MLLICDLTVLTATTNSLAIAVLLRPAARSRSTSNSRGLSGSTRNKETGRSGDRELRLSDPLTVSLSACLLVLFGEGGNKLPDIRKQWIVLHAPFYAPR